jgi:hypothetical protein
MNAQEKAKSCCRCKPVTANFQGRKGMSATEAISLAKTREPVRTSTARKEKRAIERHLKEAQKLRQDSQAFA